MSFATRFWSWFGAAPGTPVAAGSAGEMQAPSEFSLHAAMATASRFPWVWVCTRARAGDLAGLPLRAIRRDGSLETVLADHPALNMIRRPSPGWTGLRWRRQVYFDWSLAGNAMWRRPQGTDLLYRLHPHLTVPEVQTGTTYQTGWIYNGNQPLPLSEVHHVADVAWTIGVSMILGETPIRALHDDLSTMIRAQEMTKKQAGRGRLEMILSPGSPEASLDADSIKRLEENYERFTKSGRGAFFVGEGLKAQPVNLTAKDIEYAALRTDLRDVTLAVFEVPPARAGVATANYGTQKQQMRTYWESLLKGQGALFDDELSELTGAVNVRLEHDATNVEALQTNYTERLLRCERWVNLGATPKDAAAYEGFPNAPVGNSMAGRMRPPDMKAEEPHEERAAAMRKLLHREYLLPAAERYQVRILAADGDVSAVAAQNLEALHALAVLERAGIPSRAALQWASDIAEVADQSAQLIAREAWESGVTRIGLPQMAAFSEDRAAEIVSGLGVDLSDHRTAA